MYQKGKADAFILMVDPQLILVLSIFQMICFLLKWGMSVSTTMITAKTSTNLAKLIRVILQLQYLWGFESLLFNLEIYQIIFISYMQAQSSLKQQSEQQVGGRWTKQEHERFIKALMEYGKNWKFIENAVQTRTTSQVRSHAQKFFLKMIKIEKQRKKNLKKGLVLVTKAEQQLKTSLCDQSISSNTPLQILHFLKKEIPQKEQKREIQKEKKQVMPKQQTKSRSSNLLEEMLGSNEQQSFLVSLIKHNMNFFDKEQALTQLIDFPELHKEEKQEEQTSNKRKISFSLYDEEEDEGRYNEMVKKMKGE